MRAHNAMDPVVFARYCIVWYKIAWSCIILYNIAWYQDAMDPLVFDRNTEKPVYGVHLEQAAMIQVGALVRTAVTGGKYKYSDI